jgi:hypothetical protein
VFAYGTPRFDQSLFNIEMRPIIGWRNTEWEFIINPIVDFATGRYGEADFVPAVRLARKLGEDFYIGAEYYADYGKISNFLPLQQQQQLLFAVTDFKAGVFDIDLGLGFGMTSGSDRLIGKIIIGYAFPASGGDKSSDGGSRGDAMMPRSMMPTRRTTGLSPAPAMIQ